jgi:hypothetical protein
MSLIYHGIDTAFSSAKRQPEAHRRIMYISANELKPPNHKHIISSTIFWGTVWYEFTDTSMLKSKEESQARKWQRVSHQQSKLQCNIMLRAFQPEVSFLV